MSSSSVWFRTAYGHLRSARANVQIGEYDTAYREALSSGEIALKAVLVKAGCYVDKPKSAGGDRHHESPTLAEKIRSHGIIPQPLADDIVDLAYQLDRVDLTSPTGDYANCAMGQVGDLRYSYGASTPFELTTLHDANQKIGISDELLRKLAPFT